MKWSEGMIDRSLKNLHRKQVEAAGSGCTGPGLELKFLYLERLKLFLLFSSESAARPDVNWVEVSLCVGAEGSQAEQLLLVLKYVSVLSRGLVGSAFCAVFIFDLSTFHNLPPASDWPRRRVLWFELGLRIGRFVRPRLRCVTFGGSCGVFIPTGTKTTVWL